MPIALHPDQTIDVRLDIDKPLASAPTFKLRFLTCAQVLKVEALLKQVHAETDQAKASALLTEAISIGLVGWSVELGEFNPARLDDMLTPIEKWELAYKVTGEVQLAEIDKKKSALASLSTTEKAASTATASA